MARLLAFTIIIITIALGGLFLLSHRASGPVIDISQPVRVVGLTATLDFAIEAPRGDISRIDVAVEQDSRSLPLFSLSDPKEALLTQETPNRIRVSRSFGQQDLPTLQPGVATLIVSAARPILFGFSEKITTIKHQLAVDFDPPRLTTLSTFHYINHGGSEMVIYQVIAQDVVESGVRVGELTYPGYPAANAGVTGADETVKVSFFGLLFDQELSTPIELYAIDEAGNEGRAQFDYRILPQVFKRTRINLNDAFLQRVVPNILERSPVFREKMASGENFLSQYVRINGDMRRENAETINSVTANTAPRKLWQGPFHQLYGSQVESQFAAHRTYFYEGNEVDQQIHLGVDLAVTANIPITAANHGKVIYAGYLGIYGNCLLIDHGMNLQSLYAHLSSFTVTNGDSVEKNEQLGFSGISGLAGGDHLHFTMLLQGQPVNPIEWWDPHWIEDRITRKLREATRLVANEDQP